MIELDLSKTRRLLDELSEKIRREFPGDAIEAIATRIHAGHAEVWVYVASPGRLEEIRKRCEILGASYESAEPPIWLIVRQAPAPEKRGQEEAELRRKREDFVRRMEARHSGSRP